MDFFFSQESEDVQKSSCSGDLPPPVSLAGADASKHVVKLRRASSTDAEATFSTLVKAGCLLTNIKINVTFQHEEEQRQVLALAYDAFKCQTIFTLLPRVVYFLSARLI